MNKIIVCMLLCVVILSGCSGKNSSITVGGSNSVQPLFSEYIDEYKAINPGVAITYDGQGSSKGIEGIKNKSYQIGVLSRDLKPQELTDDMTVKTIALDGVAVVVSEDNPVDSLTMDQLRQIYTGEITNWSQVGGKDEAISVVSRDSASGTREAFETILGFGIGDPTKPLTEKSIVFNSNGGVAESVSKNSSAIGYISMETLKLNQDTLKVVKIDGFAPSEATIRSGEYKLVRPFNIVYKENEISENTKEFIKWIDENADEMAADSGYISVK